jgi:DNA processing protein
MTNERIYWLGFASCSGIGPTRFGNLLSHFGTAENAWKAEEKELITVIGKAFTEKFLSFRKEFSPQKYAEKIEKTNVSFLSQIDPDYPVLLKKSSNAPLVLFVKGKFTFNALENKKTIAIVGTRKITEYGKHVTELLTQELVARGCVIVSGLALGVDACTHKTTISNKGKTIAVLGCGVDCCYPRENERLYQQIFEHDGAVVSEYGLGQPPTIGSFPSRNRIIAGLSLGIVVTEGAADSGALITAKDAFTNNRKVFAVPGPVTSSLSAGPYQLIKQGATIVSSAKEILDELGFLNQEARKTKKVVSDNKDEQKIIDLLQNEDIHFDELVRRTQINSTQLGTILSLMEMKGMVKSLSAGFFGLA